MQLKHWLTLSIAPFLLVSCAGGTTGDTVAQTPESPAAQTVPASPAETAQTAQTAETAETAEKSGTFVAGEHPTEGTVRLVTRSGQTLIELGQDFETSDMGPDLVVILHRSDDVIGSTQPPAYALNEGDYVVIAPLQQFKGTQSYPIPDNINLADYQSAGIWCRKFNATFGAAVLR
jgi:hypothetical protein